MPRGEQPLTAPQIAAQLERLGAAIDQLEAHRAALVAAGRRPTPQHLTRLRRYRRERTFLRHRLERIRTLSYEPPGR